MSALKTQVIYGQDCTLQLMTCLSLEINMLCLRGKSGKFKSLVMRKVTEPLRFIFEIANLSYSVCFAMPFPELSLWSGCGSREEAPGSVVKPHGSS